ncbi:MAG: O-antigen ligase family protein [Cytophagales bacterium]
MVFQKHRRFAESPILIGLEMVGISMILVGTLVSHVRLTYANIGLLICGVCVFVNYSLGVKPVFIFNKKIIWAFACMLFVYIISLCIHQEGWQVSWEYLRNKMLLVGFPLVFCLVRYRCRAIEYIYVWLYIGFANLICLFATLNYIFYLDNNFSGNDVLNERYIPFAIQHHMISIMINVVIFLTLDFYFKNKENLQIWQTIGIAIVILADFAFIFITGARVGMLILIISIIIVLFYKLKSAKKLVIPILIVCIAIFTLLFNFSASVKGRIEKTISEINYVVNSYKNEDTKVEHVGNFTARIISYQDNFELIKLNFWTGIGLVQFDETLVRHFDTIYAKDDYVHRQFPPNTWLRYALSMGVPLMFLFMLFFLMPLFLDSNFKNMLVLLSFLSLFIYSNSEAPLEYTMPFRFYVVLLCLVFRNQYALNPNDNIVNTRK